MLPQPYVRATRARSYLDQLEEIAASPDVVVLGVDPAPDAASIATADIFIRSGRKHRELLIRPGARGKVLPAWRRQNPPAALADLLITETRHLTVYRRLSKTVRTRVHAFRLPPEV